MSVFTNDVTSETLALDTSVQALTKPSDIQLVDGSAHTQPVSGTVTANAGTGTLLVDGSAHTQPISGTVTANIGTTGGLALDATLTGGTQKTKIIDTGGTNALSVSAGGAAKVDGSAVTQPVSGTVSATQGTSPWVVSGTVTTTAGSSNTATTTRVATSTTAALALAANANRKQAIITTETGNTYVSLGSTATTTNYAFLLTATSSLEVPSMWTGTVSVIRASGSGNIQVVEMV